jgi:hypothetical protein
MIFMVSAGLSQPVSAGLSQPADEPILGIDQN